MSKRSSKGFSRECQGSFKDILRKFQGCLKKSVKCVSRKFQKKLQGCFENVSMKFCYVILLLHGSHRSYLTRGRACLSRRQGPIDYCDFSFFQSHY